jgi:hypothetical protein
MKKLTQTFLVGAVVIGTAALSYAYAACYTYFWEPQCAKPGDCFGQCTPLGCQTATCIQATGFGREHGQYNLIPWQSGGYPFRQAIGLQTCFVDGCRIYNNCTQAYENLPADCSCSFEVTAWMGVGAKSVCQ